ncbi:MAG: outer membrane protein assembly factor BamA [Elusimicrobia bacterium]|nr:outer membrane protein assembly factor BamA [Elusimicrobiota bacterium]
MAMLLFGVFASPAAGQEASSSTTTAPVPLSSAAVQASVSTAAPAGMEAPVSSTTVSVATAAPVLLPGIPPLTPFGGSVQAPSPAAAAPAAGVVLRPWVIGEIAVEGNKNVKPGTVRSQVKARKGSLYDRPDLDRDVQTLLGMGNFERVAADVALMDKPVPAHFAKVSGSDRQVRLTFLVKEKPLVKKLRFNGNKKLSRSALDDATTLKAKDPLDDSKLREDQRKILAKYREKGFLDAQARYEVRRDTGTLQAEVDWFVVEGPKSHITAVTITGIKAFKPKKLLKLMKNRTKGWFRAGAYSEKDLPEDIKKISDHYKNHGYLDIFISSPTVKFSPDKTRITIAMDLLEGRAYKFGDTTFSGNIIFTSTELVKALEYRRGRVFNQEKFDMSLRSIQELYADKGRLRARLTPVKTLNAKTDLMDAAVSIVEGDIVYIEHVDVEGNKATKTYVLKREVTVKPGQAFSLSRIKKSRERIMNLGFIDDVDIDIQPTPEPDKVDLTFDVAEGKPGMLTAGAAYSSIDGLIGTLSLQHMNLFGRAQRASLQWSFGRRVQDYSASWMTPWVYDKPVSFGLDAFNTRRISPYSTSLSAYVQKRTGGTVRVGPRFQEDVYHLNLSYTFSKVSIENVEQDFLGTLSPGTSIYSSLSAEFARDTRDNIWDPSHGTRHSVGAALTGGPLLGDVHFIKPWVSNAGYWTLCTLGDESWPVVLGASNRASYVTQFGETKEVPVFERFFIGGQDTLRGYNATGEAGFPTGGKVYNIFNIEIGAPLARERKKTIVKLVGFFDLGGAWDRAKDISGRIGSGTRDIKTDAGVGIRFVTPAFPIRLDWGYGFNHRPGERLYQINFGMGNLF